MIVAAATSTWQDNAGGIASVVLVLGFVAGLTVGLYKLANWIGDITEKLTRNTVATEVVQAAVTPNHGTSMADEVNRQGERIDMLLERADTNGAAISEIRADQLANATIVVDIGERLVAVEQAVHGVRSEQSKVADALAVTPPITGEVPIISNRAESGGRAS